jgi:hypothetical protein
LGWEDYFENINQTRKNKNNYAFKHYQVIEHFPLIEYKNHIREIYNYNSENVEKIKNTMELFGLIPGKYDAIFIRRGDKLTSESKYIPAEEYMKCLLSKNPDSNVIFLQTDDYNSYLELEDYINTYKLNIRIITLCKKEYKGGMIIFDFNLNNGLEKAVFENVENRDYLKDVIGSLRINKPINKMSPDEMFEHTMDMIIGIDIVINSNICICDYSSNVSRFIKLAHKSVDNVIDVLNPDLDIDMNKVQCPAFGF